MENQDDAININRIAADAAATYLQSLAAQLTGPSIKAFERARYALTAQFSTYIESTYNRLSVTRTILHSDQDVSIYDLYVDPTLSRKKKEISGSSLLTRIRPSSRILLKGTAGGGKSILLKFITCSMLASGRSVLPIHYELRGVNEAEDKPLLEILFDHVAKLIPALNFEIFVQEIKSGSMALVLDAVDEIEDDKRSKYISEIEHIIRDYPKCCVIITTRPEEAISQLSALEIYDVQPLNKEQCIELISKLDYNQERKDAFIERVEQELYQKHPEFLSSPLLSTMMLMTFSEAGEVPDKLTSFYKQAYEVLFYKHDWSKGGLYKRELKSKLPIDEFEKIFSYFCARSYAEENFLFGEVLIRTYLKEAISYQSAQCAADDVLEDLLKCVCLIQRDGLYYVFVHRSFQEYFTALFISKQKDERAKAAIDSILVRSNYDSVARMVYQIDQDLFERAWVILWIDQFEKELAPLVKDNKYKEYYGKLWKYIYLSSRDGLEGFIWHEVPLAGSAVHLIREIYGPTFEADTDFDSEAYERSRKSRIATFRKRLKEDTEFAREMADLLGAPKTGEPTSRQVRVLDVSEKVFSTDAELPWADEQVLFMERLASVIRYRVAAKAASFDAMFR